ncbi:MAG: hypothetical protein IKN85_11035 [Oscillospiraceae bacterium]|nr:hypothetical protein [Oscillospiraceae bacterium]
MPFCTECGIRLMLLIIFAVNVEKIRKSKFLIEKLKLYQGLKGRNYI